MTKKFTHSVVSGGKLKPVFSLGDFFTSDFLKDGEKPKYPKSPLAIAFDPISGVAQLTEQPENEALWGSMYFYVSHSNKIMRDALRDLAEKALEKSKNKEGVFVDIASNSFELLKNVPESFERVGIDPSDYNQFATPDRVDLYIRDYFSAEAYFKNITRSADIVSCAAVFYDLSNPEKFLRDVGKILTDDGLFVMQISYTPLNLELLEVGVICQEHLCYYNLISLDYIFNKSGLVIRDIELNEVNGGSIRVYAQKQGSKNYQNFLESQVAQTRIKSLLEYEYSQDYDTEIPYLEFFDKLNKLKVQTIKFLESCKQKGEKVYGIGSSTKANTLLQFLSVDSTLVQKITDCQEVKHGRHTIGTNIPIVPEKELLEDMPKYAIVFPWFFLPEILKKEKEYLDQGGVIIVPCPKLRFFTKDGEINI